MIETLKTLGISFLAFGAAGILAGIIGGLVVWSLREERPFWIRGLMALFLLLFLVIYPLILLISSWINTDPYQPYDDSPGQEEGFDRYS